MKHGRIPLQFQWGHSISNWVKIHKSIKEDIDKFSTHTKECMGGKVYKQTKKPNVHWNKKICNSYNGQRDSLPNIESIPETL